MRRKILSILVICLLLVGVAWGAMDSAAKRKIAQGIAFLPTPPVADGTIDAFDRASLGGVYGMDFPAPATDTTDSGCIRPRYKLNAYRNTYRNRYND
jgi:hypothetical protein